MAGEIERWHDFYVLVGTAGATLVALLFVAVSIGTGFLTEQRAAPTRAFYSPVVLHFTAVFFISAAGLVPAHTAVFFAGSVAVAALIGGGASVFATVQLLRNRWTSYVQDHLAYGLLPFFCTVTSLKWTPGLTYVLQKQAMQTSRKTTEPHSELRGQR